MSQHKEDKKEDKTIYTGVIGHINLYLNQVINCVLCTYLIMYL